MDHKILVTGGTGFVGVHILLQLLQKGYDVKTTLRSMKKKDMIIETLKENGVQNLEQLSFIEADLSEDRNWEEAMEGRDYVFSVASPVFFHEPESEEEAIRPAVEGITRILKAAQKMNVTRVVMTSNFGAVGFSKKAGTGVVTTEEDWTDENAAGLSIYEKSKLLAERAAWDFVNQPDTTLEFATVNPVAIFGPSLSEHISGSFMLINNLLNGSMKRIPEIPLNIVDVRDVADIHIRAMLTPEANGERFIASADGQTSLQEIAELLKAKRPQIAHNVSTKKLPNAALRTAALVNKQAKEGLLMHVMNRNVKNDKAKQMLGWQPISTNEEVILASVDSMAKFKLI
ncbi:SDR family oxidoreductase [Listeria booriae]|uniref:SDR family oxidoreductase n=1 Tax=Listeria booriae TaxID=1552123 RepID=UPI001625E5AE|nr:aldehyde reductase [Listeria booriae]MBC2365875.1 aldehyde reductase [Listeria booriae]